MKQKCVAILLMVGLCVAMSSVTPSTARSQEFYALGGVQVDTSSHATGYTWQIEYAQTIKGPFAWSFSYLNQGHAQKHHRDGAVAQVWGRTDESLRSVSLAAGIGIYRYFDTVDANSTSSNEHGWGAVTSIAGTWRMYGPWRLQVRANWVHAERGIDDLSLLAGLGYRFDTTSVAEGRHAGGEARLNEVTLFLGESVMNNFSSNAAFAQGIEYRRDLGRFLQWTVSGLHEGNTNKHRRAGIATQLWAGRSFFDDRLSLGFGVGPYFVTDTRASDDESIFGIFTLSAAYRFTPRWAARFSWNRVGTNNNSDSDIFLVGVGYRF